MKLNFKPTFGSSLKTLINKPMKKAILLAIIILSTYSILAQTQKRAVYEIRGTVLEKASGQGLEMATIIVKPEQGSRLYGGMTDRNGKYNVEVPQGVYQISFEFLSFKTHRMKDVEVDQNLTLETVYLEEDAEALAEVEVIAERSTVEVKLDKKIYNVGKDMTIRGGTASDVLDNVPSVTVDVDGVVSLRGNENVRILINGKPSGLIGINDTEALRQFPADAIKKVEVITSPSARYDAEGTAGILNIILRRDKITGFNGVGTVNIGSPEYYGFSTSLNYRLKKVNFFTNIGYSDREAPGKASYQTYYLSPTANYAYTDQQIEYERLRKNLNANFGLEYFFTPNTSVAASFLYRDAEGGHRAENITDAYDEDDQIENTTQRIENETSDGQVNQFDLGFFHKFNEEGHEIDFDFQFQDNSDLENTLITNEELYPTESDQPSEKIIAEDQQQRFLIQSDYVLPIGDHQQVELGFRVNINDHSTDYRFFNEDANGDFIVNDQLTNLFEYDEQISAVYGQYGNKLGKFSALLGLRLEATDIEIRSTGKDIDSLATKEYTNFFPTLNLSYELKENENITLGFNSRIRRPRSRFINPFPSQSSKTVIFQGNPDLDPSISRGVDVGYYKRWQKVTFNTSLYYNHGTDVFQFISMDTGESTEEGIPIIRRTPINLSSDDRFGWEFSLNYIPIKNWRLNGSFNYYGSNLEGEYEGIDYGSSYNSWFARFSAKIPLPGKIDWQTNMRFRGPRQNAQSTSKSNFVTNLAFSKDLLKGNGTIVFNIDDLFNSRKRITDTYTDTFTQYSEFQYRQRQFRLSFTYRFNQKKKRQSQRGSGNDGDMEEGF